MSKARKINVGNKISNNPFEGREGLIYARVSSKRQEVEGSGLISQEGRCMDYLKSMKVPYLKTFPDSISGGGDFMKRPGMREMLKYIDAHPHKKFVIVFDDLKRFARDTEFHLKLRTALRARDVIPKCLNYNFDDSPEGMFVETILSAGNELERHQNRRQVIQKQKARLMLGYWAFGSKKGYTMTKSSEYGTISIPNRDSKILKEALEGFSNGTFIRKIDACRFLVEKGFWKKQSPEKYIDKFTELVKDPFYVGFIEYPAWEVARRTGKHKGIISLETFELNQKRLGNLDLGKRIRNDISDEFPLRGLLACKDCGKHITGGWIRGRNKKHPYYWCQNKTCPSFWKANPREIVESKFIKLLKETKLKKDVAPVVKLIFNRVWEDEISNFKKSKNELELQKIDLENKIEALINLILSSKNEAIKGVYEHQIEFLGNKINEIKSSLPTYDLDLNIPYRTALEKATGLLKNPYDIWVTLNTKEQQSLFYFIFEKKLLYSRNEGYRTAQVPSVVRLFEEFATSNTQDVETGEIESPCRRF